ncbi:MAG: hypothetical protein IK021_02490 [Methanobrevibacter sp.]|nr:hypothetical protein [Methanobrevibacter sp.]
MTYKLDKVTIRLKNDAEGIAKISELFADIFSGDIPLLFNSDNELIEGFHLYLNIQIMKATKLVNRI